MIQHHELTKYVEPDDLDDLYDRYEAQADENIEKWGLQDKPTHLLAMQEELGELTRAHLEAEHESGDPDLVEGELVDLGALLLQFYGADSHK